MFRGTGHQGARQRGFTLIEAMVTVAIIAILAAIALPQYTDYVRRGKLAEGQSALLALKTRFEQYYQDSRTYCATGGCPACGVSMPSQKYFSLSATCSATGYTITAAGGSSTDSSLSGLAYTITEANLRATTVSGGAMGDAGWGGNASCWVTRKGAC